MNIFKQIKGIYRTLKALQAIQEQHESGMSAICRYVLKRNPCQSRPDYDFAIDNGILQNNLSAVIVITEIKVLYDKVQQLEKLNAEMKEVFSKWAPVDAPINKQPETGR